MHAAVAIALPNQLGSLVARWLLALFSIRDGPNALEDAPEGAVRDDRNVVPERVLAF
jgi:hypothetical protein